MTTMIDQENSPTVEAYVFTALDRCDAECSAQAYHRCVKDGLDLLFCNHHYQKFEEKIFLDGFEIQSDVQALADLGVKHYIYSEQ